VCGEAQVYGKAQVSGSARVCGKARVFNSAQVFGGNWEISPLHIQGSVHALTTCSFSEIDIGCEIHTVSHWLKNYKTIGEANGYSEREIEEYFKYLKLADWWLKDAIDDE
jgi:hypothetical protein